MIEKGSQLRTKLLSPKSFPIPRAPGYYRWWFPEAETKRLLTPLHGVEVDIIKVCKIQEEPYCSLYFGISKDLRGRICWHLNQKHSTSAVAHGFLSTLRQTLSALLDSDMTQAQETVNALLDSCRCEWITTKNYSEARDIEKKILKSEYHPLNLADNKKVANNILEQIKQLRKHHKK